MSTKKNSIDDMIEQLVAGQEKTASAEENNEASAETENSMEKKAAMEKLASDLYASGKIFGKGIIDHCFAKIAEISKQTVSSHATKSEKSMWERIALEIEKIHSPQGTMNTEGATGEHSEAKVDGPNRIAKPTSKVAPGQRLSTPNYNME